MTSHFDDLMYLWQMATSEENQEDLLPLLRLIYTEAAEQLNKVAPKVYNWEKYFEEGFGRFYEDEHLLVQQMNFINEAHDELDHRDYHLKCFRVGFVAVFSRIIDVLKRKYFRGWDRPRLYLRWLQADDFRRYRVIWEEVVKLVDKDIISVSERNLQWKRVKSGWYWRTEK